MSAQKEKMSTGKAIFTVVMSVISAGMTIYFDCGIESDYRREYG